VGTLNVVRDPGTFILQEYDRCVSCGQQVRYIDIDDMRSWDGAGLKDFPHVSAS
jgi:hypothetical protein